MARLFFDFFNVYFLVASVLVLFWFYIRSTYNFWQKFNVKSLEPIPFFGNTAAYSLGQKTFHETIDMLYKKLVGQPYGGYYDVSDPILLVKDPDLVTSILVTDFASFHDHRSVTKLNYNRKVNPLNEHLHSNEGERWKIVRQKMRPFFSFVRMKQMHEQMLYCVSMLTRNIDAQMNETGSLDVTIKPLIDRMAIDVVGTCAFGIECNSLNSNDTVIKMCSDIFKPMKFLFAMRMATSIFGKRLAYLLNWRDSKKEKSDFFMNLVFDMIQHRRQNNIVRNDLLQLMMNLQNSSIDPELACEEKYQEVSTDERFDEIDIAANTFLFFFAGYETSSSTMSFCLYEIALNENIQRRLHSEIKLIHDEYKTISYDSLKEMHYLDAVISETFRKYPTITCLDRKCNEDFLIPGTKARIPAGIKVVVPVWSIHHDPKIYPNPDVFDPERFLGDNKHSRPNGVYLPFGDGPRQCLGKNFSITELKTALSAMILKYHLKPCSKTEIPLTFEKGMTILAAQHGIWLNVSKRKI